MLRRAANLLLARPPAFTITGTGRCGTDYAARRLSGLGIACSHEGYFTPDGPKLRNPDRDSGTRGDASWLAPPFVRAGEMPVIHLVRRPEDVIHSFYSIGFFDSDFRTYHRPFLAFAERYFEIGDDSLDACIRWYLEWNRRCERIASLTVKIEHFEESLPGIITHIGIEPTRDAPAPSPTSNKRPSVFSRPISRPELDRRIGAHPLGQDVADMAELYGYGPGPCGE